MKDKISSEFAEILGLLCSEGCHSISYSSYWGMDRGKRRFFKNHKNESIQFYNKDLKLLKHYQMLVYKEFEYKIKITKNNKLNICKRLIIKKIIDQTPLGHLSWKIPNSVIYGDKNIKIAFLRGYFDGDGTSSGCARFFSTNKSGLNQVAQLLKNLKIKHTFQGPIIKAKRKPAYIIQISRKEKEIFLNLINPVSKIPGKL